MRYTEGWKYRIYEFEIIETQLRPDKTAVLRYKGEAIAWLNVDGTLVLTNDFAWNGADCFPDTDSILLGSAAHDCLLTMLGAGLLCDLSDKHKTALIKLLIDETLRDVYRNSLLTKASKCGLIKKAWYRSMAGFMADRVFRAVQKWGTPTGMKPVEVKEAF